MVGKESQRDVAKVSGDYLTDEDWRAILDLSETVANLPVQERLYFLQSTGCNPRVVREVLALLPEFDAPARLVDLVGTTIGRFVITECVGHGGMGDVYLAEDTELGRRVALKFLTAEAVRSQGAFDRFIYEARTASALNHPSIVTVHDVIHSDTVVAIVMEYVEGIVLRELCGTSLPIPQVLRIGLQIAQGLAAAHASGVVHRDMKPENVIVQPNGRIKVLDFGLAQRITPAECTSDLGSTPGLPAGTLRYMSPEHGTGEKITGSSDVFSLGLILYEICTGKYPFPVDSPLGTLQAIVGSEVASVSQLNPLVPERLDALIRAMMSKDARARPRAEIVAEELENLSLPHETSRSLAPASRSDTRHYKWPLASLLVAGLAITGWFLKPSSPPTKKVAFYQVTTLLPENRATAAAISPDGKVMAYATIDGVFIRISQTSTNKRLNAPPDFTVERLEWFTDQTRLLASGSSDLDNATSTWIVNLNGDAPRLVRTHARQATISPNGTDIAFLTDNESAIWIADLNGGHARQIVAGPGRDTFPVAFWSPDGRRLSFQRRHATENRNTLLTFDPYYERSYESVAAATGRTLASVRNIWIDSAVPLRDGRILFLLFYPAGTDVCNQLWEVRTDPSTGAFLGSPQTVASPIPERLHADELADVSATKDGTEVMVLRRSDQDTVFVADFEHSPPRITHSRRLTLDDKANYPHAWTPDSRTVIFESDRNGNYDLFKQQIDRRTPDVIVATPSHEVVPQLAPDGHSVLYAAREPGDHPWRLMRVSLSGGTPEEVFTGGPLDEFRCALGSGRRCVLRTTVGHRYYVYYDLDPVRGKGRELARTAWIPELLGDWDVSPDGRRVAIPNHDPHMARVRLVSLLPDSPSEREIMLPGLNSLVGLTWAAAGDGWLVHAGGQTRHDAPTGHRLLYVYLNGRSRLLGVIQGWAVPSPDGRRVAFENRLTATNAWIIDRR